MRQVTITTEQVHELIEQLAAMTAAASITPEIVANILEKMRNLNDQEREKVIAVAEAKIAEIQDIGIAADHVTFDSGATVENVVPESVSTSAADLMFSDEQQKVVLKCAEGHLQTKYFDSKNIEKANLSQDVKDSLDKIKKESTSVADLMFSDEQQKVVLKCAEGHLQTKYFDSKNVADLLVKSTQQADVIVTDDNGNVVLAVWRGYIITKNFSSVESLKRSDVLPMVNSLLEPSDYHYSGARIDIKTHGYSVKNDRTAFANTTGKPCQGFSIWEDYALFFYDAGIVDISTISTDNTGKLIFTKIAGFNLGSYDESTNHANNSSWGVEHIDDNPFPVCYISKGLDGKCAVENITLEGATCVQTLYLSGYRDLVNADTRFGYTVGDDGYLYLTGFTNPSHWLETTKCFVAKMTLPKLSEGANVGLDLNEAIEFYYLEDYGYTFRNITLQGRYVKNGQIIFLTGTGHIDVNPTDSRPTAIYVWNIGERKMQNHLYLQSLIPTETEDCDVYKDELILRCNPNNVIYRMKF